MNQSSNLSSQLIHSFPRPKAGDDDEATLARALKILELIKDIGLVLAPEVLEWGLQQLVPDQKPLHMLQRRLCLTELPIANLPTHSKVFGPLALTFDSAKLRDAGAMPVIYVPQGLGTPLSLIGTFCVNGTHHTKHVLKQLQELKKASDPQTVAQATGLPVSPGYTLDLKNTDAAGRIVASFTVPANYVKNVMDHVGFNNIPFDHSEGVLGVFLNMFCPTDNLHLGEPLGYYRQREWRLIAGDVRVNGHPIGRDLSPAEKQRLVDIDSVFWNRPLEVDGKPVPRKDLALIYDPTPGWDVFDLIGSIHAPAKAISRVRKIVGDKVAVHKMKSRWCL